jgi:hypothetical protein
MEARAEYIGVAEKLVRDGNEARAREVQDKLVRMEPGNVLARTALADIFLNRGDSAKAIAEFLAAARGLEQLSLTAGERGRVPARPRDAPGGACGAGGRRAGAGALGRRRRGDPDGSQAARATAGRPRRGRSAGGGARALRQIDEAEELVKSAPDAAEGAITRLVLGRLHARAGRVAQAEPLLLPPRTI